MANPILDQQMQPGQTTPVPDPGLAAEGPTLAPGGMAGGMDANSGNPNGNGTAMDSGQAATSGMQMPSPNAPVPVGPNIQRSIQQTQQQGTVRTPQEEADRQAGYEQESAKDKIASFLTMLNIAEQIDSDTLVRIGTKVVEDYKIDFDSCAAWREQNKEGVALAQMIGKTKMYAEGIVANVKYPTLAIAAIQFAARAYPNIISGDQVVKGKKFGADLDSSKQKRADRMATFMSWQLLEQMDGWDEETDQLLVILPVVGCVFRKTYRDYINDKNVSEMVQPEDFVINYFTKSLERAPHFTQHVVLYPNEIIERVRDKKFLDKEFGIPVTNNVVKENQDTRDDDKPHLFLEQHRWEDLDGDGYKEPYVITVHHDTQQVVRIVARFDVDGIKTNDKNQIVRIEPLQYFTRYLFFPAFDGGFYGMGFGSLIGPINKTVNTNLNQLLDAGTMANRQCGFLGKGIRLPEGTKSLRFKHGEWKYVDVTGDDLRKNVFPLPANAPSEVLFKLLTFMVDAAKELASNADVLSGNQPAANVPATTTLALIEQGLKVYSSIYLRVHKSLNREFKKLKYLDKLFVEEDEYKRVLDDPAATTDDFYDSDLDITPVSDVADLNDMQKIMKAQALKECIGEGLNDPEIWRRYFTALNIQDVPTLLNAPAPKTDPRVEIEQIKAQLKQTELALREKEIEYRHQLDTVKATKTQSDANLVDERARSQALDQQITVLKFELEKEKQNLAELQAHAGIVADAHQHARDTVDMAHQHEVDRRELDIKDKETAAKEKDANKPTPKQGAQGNANT
jgi:chaperonin GroES